MGIRLKRQEILVISVPAIFLSVLATLWTQGMIFKPWQEDEHYQNVTFTDAVIQCQNAARAQFDVLLQTLTMDDLSSRQDHDSELYRIFFNAQVAKSPNDPDAVEFYISCLVNARHGNIAEYNALEKKERASEPIRKNKGGIFGWPLN
jgi:hypothetical protein